MARRNLVSEFLSEVCNYGGLSASRGEIYQHVLEVGRSHGASDTSCHRAADRACCAYPLLSDAPNVVGTLKSFQEGGAL